MEAELFTDRRTGDLVRIPEGGVAFVPNPLPVGHHVLTPDLVLALEQATTELGRLDGLGSTLPDTNLLIGPFLRKEAELSSRMEGTQTTFSELVMFEAADGLRADGDLREVSNYVVALKYALSRARDTGISRTLLNETQRLLLAGTGEAHRSGRFRDSQVFIGPRGFSIAEARYVPPPAHRIDELIDNLERYIADGERLPFLVRLAVVHYQFEAIHPFFDGNGRIGRLLMPLLLVHSGMLRAPMLYLSAYFERRRAAYNDAMFAVSADGRWSDWITFVLRGIALQAQDALSRVAQLNRLRSTILERGQERPQRGCAAAADRHALRIAGDVGADRPQGARAIIADLGRDPSKARGGADSQACPGDRANAVLRRSRDRLHHR